MGTFLKEKLKSVSSTCGPRRLRVQGLGGRQTRRIEPPTPEP